MTKRDKKARLIGIFEGHRLGLQSAFYKWLSVTPEVARIDKTLLPASS
jgi:hypothetical protein